MNLDQFKEYLFERMMDRQLDFSTQHNGERENVEKVMCSSPKKSQRHKQQIGLSYRQPMFLGTKFYITETDHVRFLIPRLEYWLSVERHECCIFSHQFLLKWNSKSSEIEFPYHKQSRKILESWN